MEPPAEPGKEQPDAPPAEEKPAEQPAEQAESSLESPTKEPADDVNALDTEPPANSDKPLSNTEGLDQSPKENKPKKRPLNAKKNIYVIAFAALFLIAGGITAFAFMSSNKKPPVATIGNQPLSQEALSQLANSDTSVGGAAQTLTVHSNATFAGQVLVRGGLTVANNTQVGGTLQAPDLVISNTANLGTVQAKSIQVAEDAKVQGSLDVSKDLSVSGVTTFSGPVMAGQITVTRLVLSGNASLEVPNHLAFTGSTPLRSINTATAGAGGSITIGGSDTSGTININTGSGPQAGCFIQVTFNKPFPSMPHVIVSPFGQAAGNLQYYVTKSTTGFNLCTNNAAAGGSAFGFDYFITY
jgi:cytoskeletal protein CcmA (bactofilin family)